MRINRQVVVFDAADLAAESTFWAGVLDGTVDAEDDWHTVMVDGEPRVGVQLAPNHVPPRLARRHARAADPPRPVGRGPRGRPRSCHVARSESAQASRCGRRLRRQLPGLRGSCRASVLSVPGSRTRAAVARRRRSLRRGRSGRPRRSRDAPRPTRQTHGSGSADFAPRTPEGGEGGLTPERGSTNIPEACQMAYRAGASKKTTTT